MKQKQLNAWEIAIVTITIVLFTVANSLEVFSEWLKNKPGFVFHAIAHSYPDYFLYLSHVAQGVAGHLIFTNHLFTDEVLPPTAFYWAYSLIGYIGHLFVLSPPWSYNLSLLILVAIAIFLWYVLCRCLFPSNRAARLATFLVTLSASPFINIQALLTRGVVEFPPYLWFSPTPAFNRMGGVPHQIVQTILLLILLFGISKAKNIRSILLLMIVSFAAAYSQPIQTALLLIAAGVTALLTDRKLLIPVVAAGLVSLPGAIAVNHEYTTPIYVIAKQWELLQYSPTGIVWWIEVIGPIVFFVPFGIWPFLKKADPLRRTFFLYGLLSFVLYNSPIPKLIGVVPQRFLHPTSYALFPVLAVSGFFAIRKDLPRFLKHFFVISAVLLYALYTIPADASQVATRVNDPSLIEASALNHTPVALVNGLRALQRMPPDVNHPVVLAEKNLGIDLLVPFYTGRISFLGQAIHTLSPDIKEALRQQFFSGAMTNGEMKQFLTDHRIGYIIASPHASDRILSYPFIQPIFRNNAMIIFATI